MTFLNCFLIYWALSLALMVWVLYAAPVKDEETKKERDNIINDVTLHGMFGFVIMFIVSLVFLPLVVVELFTSENE